MDACGPCLSGQHDQCDNELVVEPICSCAHVDLPTPTPVSVIGNALNLDISADEEHTGLSGSEKRTRRQKDDSAVRDPNSTGRKRAAAMFPLKDETGKRFPCDMALKKNALPNYYEVQIDGCGVRAATMQGVAQARHHWNYNTLDNTRENIGLLCNSCHAMVHAKNDPFKDKIYERLYGVRPATKDLKTANKALISGKISGGKINEAQFKQPVQEPDS